ncbi:MAG TPA: gamma-glutamyltransferase, partial [Bacteroidales bacterium]|nr:gamma-glutamyltransferase [Bacteroidales bacterium]
MKKIFLTLIVTILSINFMCAQDRITGKKFATRSEVIAKHGMAATSQPLATQVALDILKNGGNAIDAAIAANATLGLMEPTGNGMGGDIFAI